jgi:hypothetical protein
MVLSSFFAGGIEAIHGRSVVDDVACSEASPSSNAQVNVIGSLHGREFVPVTEVCRRE